jgi:hypothetical protein
LQGLASVRHDLLRIVSLGADRGEVRQDRASSSEGLPLRECALLQRPMEDVLREVEAAELDVAGSAFLGEA